MLAASPAWTTLPATDLGRARRFFEEVLGLKVVREDAGGVVFESGGGGPARRGRSDRSTFLVYPTPNPERGGHTQMAWDVDDIDAEVRSLREKGVTFEEYDWPGLKTQDGIAPILDGAGRAAWFKDTEGNLLGLVQEPPD